MQKLTSKQIAKYTVRNRKWLCTLACLLSLIVAAGIPRVSFDTSLDALLSTSDPYLEEIRTLEKDFPGTLDINFLFVAQDSASVFDVDVLRAMQELNENFSSIPYSTHINSLLEYRSPETQRRLFDKPIEDYSAAELNTVQNLALEDRLVTANLLSSDASLSFGAISTDAEGVDPQERLRIATAIIELRDELRRNHPCVGIHANSEVILEQSSQQAMVDDLSTLLPFVILACVVAICYCFKSATLGACILGHVIFTLLCTVGALGYLGYALNNISIIAPLVLVIIAVANSVHIISIYKQALHEGKSRVDSMEESLQHNFQPITLAALTTAIGFTSLNMCSSPAIQDFGQIVALGIIFAYLLTLLLMPALLVSLPVSYEREDSTSPFMESTLKSLTAFTQKNDKPIFYSCSLLAVVTLLLLPLNETDFDRLDFIATDSDIKQYYEEVSDRLNRGPALIYGIDALRPDAVIEPDFLRRVDDFNQWLSELEGIESTGSVVDVVKTANQIRNQNKERYFVVPESKTTVSNHLLGYAMVQSEDFPLFGLVNSDFSLMNLFVNATPMSNQSLIDLDQLISDRFALDFPEMNLLHGSGILLFARMDELVTIELLQGYSISLLLITLSLMIGMGSFYFGLLSIVPNLLPATIVFGLWALFVGQLDPFVMMLFSISIGLVVDDTVHLLSHYLDKRRIGADKEFALGHAIRTAGPALTITTIVLALGTTILIGASTLYFQQAAKLLVPIVIIALLLDLIYLPTILRRFDNQFKTSTA